MEVTTKFYKLKGKEFAFRNNPRTLIEFERMTGKTVTEIAGIEDQLSFVYAGTVSGMKYENRTLDVDFEQFIDLIDSDMDQVLGLFSNGKDKEEEEDPAKK